MKKANLKDGTPMLVIKIDMFVKYNDFAAALTNHFYNNNEPFNAKIKKTVAMDILHGELFFYGLNGQYEQGFFEASFENSEKYNAVFSEAKNWVLKNYPHLKINQK